MKIEKYNCDWCRQDFDVSDIQHRTFVDNQYDLCSTCVSKIEDRLKGRGQAAVLQYDLKWWHCDPFPPFGTYCRAPQVQTVTSTRATNSLDGITDGQTYRRLTPEEFEQALNTC